MYSTGRIESRTCGRGIQATIHHDVPDLHEMGLGVCVLDVPGSGKPPDWRIKKPNIYYTGGLCADTLWHANDQKVYLLRPYMLHLPRALGDTTPVVEPALEALLKQFADVLPVEYLLEVFVSPPEYRDHRTLTRADGSTFEAESVQANVYAIAHPRTMETSPLPKPLFQLLLLAEQVRQGGPDSVDLSWWPEELDYEWSMLPLKRKV